MAALPPLPDGAHDEYLQLHGGAHRKLAMGIPVPSLVRHLAYWRPAQYRSDDSKKWIKQIDLCLCHLFRRLKHSGSEIFQDIDAPLVTTETEWTDSTGTKTPLIVFFDNVFRQSDPSCTPLDACLLNQLPAPSRPDNMRVIMFRFKWHHIPVTIRFELHTEYLTLTIALEASLKVQVQNTDTDGRPIYNEDRTPQYLSSEAAETAARKDTTFRYFRCSMDKLAQTLMRGGTQEVHTKIFHSLYHTVLEAFARETLHYSNIAPRLDNLDNFPIGTIFADFRTLVLGERPEQSLVDGVHRFFREPFSQDKRPNSFIVAGPLMHDDAMSSNIMTAILPFILSQPDFIDDRKFGKRYDITACQLLGGRVILVTGLAPQFGGIKPLYAVYTGLFWADAKSGG